MRDYDVSLIRDLTDIMARVPPGSLRVLGFGIPLKSKNPDIPLGWGEFDALLDAQFLELREVVFDTAYSPGLDQAYREALRAQMPMLNRTGTLS